MSEVDVERLTLKYFGLSVVLGTIGYFGVGGYLWSLIEPVQTGNTETEMLLLSGAIFVLVSIVMFLVMFPAIGRVSAKLDYERFGYNNARTHVPLVGFGRKNYEIKRKDPLNLFGVRMGLGVSAMRYDKLKERASEQREMECKVCHTEVGDLREDAAYFVEHRSRFYVLLPIPLTETIDEVDAYCAEHKPRDW